MASSLIVDWMAPVFYKAIFLFSGLAGTIRLLLGYANRIFRDKEIKIMNWLLGVKQRDLPQKQNADFDDLKHEFKKLENQSNVPIEILAKKYLRMAKNEIIDE